MTLAGIGGQALTFGARGASPDIWMMELQTVLTPSARLSMRPLAASLAGDERLARLVARGDEAACRVLYERFHQQLYRYCRSLLRNETDAQDALQITFISALGALSRGQRDAPLRPWLFRIAHNESISLLRRRRPMQELSDAYDANSVPLEEQVEERERLTELVADLHELPERQRAALIMRELSGLSHEEIALALGSSVGATKQSIFEARQSLMEFAEGRAMACTDVRRLISDADGRVLRSRRVRAHLRDCPGCGTFAAAMPERSRQLRALAPPLPALAAAGIFTRAGILTRAVGGGSAHGGDAAGLAAAGAGKAIGAAVAVKATAVAVAVTAAVGAAVALRHATPSAHPRHVPAASGVSRARGRTGPATGARSVGTGATSTVRARSAVAPVRRPPGSVRAPARSGKRGSAGNGTVTGTATGTPRATSASPLTPAFTAPGRSGQAAAAGHASAGLSHSRGLGPPAYPGQRSRSSSANRSGSSHGSGTATGATHRGQGAGLTTHPLQPHPAASAATEVAGSSGIAITTGKPVLPRAPKG
jgi:RNA polymerase sigma factor (sigma-70 family)